MNITIVNRHKRDKIGGSEIQCDLIAKGLVKKGHVVTYVVPGGGQTDYPEPYKVVPSNSNAKSLINSISKSKPDVVYWRFNKHYFLKIVRSLKKKKIPIIFAASSVNDVDPGFYRKNNGIKKKIRSLFKSYWNHMGFYYIDAVTVNNKEYLGSLPVDIQEFVPNGLVKENVPFSWNRPYCAWVSSIKQIKRPELLIDIAESSEFCDVDFLMVGEIQEKKYLWLKESDKLPANVYYLGLKSPEEVNGILEGSLFHIHTCFPEGFPNVFIQAWGQGIPSVSYGFDPSSYITDYNMGFYASENKKIFRESILELIQKPQKRAEMGRNAKAFSDKMFSTEKSVLKIEKLFKTIVRQY